MSYHDAIKSDLRKSRIDLALEKLERLIANSGNDGEHHESTFVQLSARTHRNEKARRDGISLQQDYDMENSRLSHSIFSLLKELPDQPLADGSQVDNQGATIGTQINQPVISGDLNVGGGSSSGSSDTSGSANDTIKILMMTSNPSDTVKLNLDREHSRISSELEGSSNFEDYKLFRQRETNILHLTKSIIKHDPHIVHFSGHGQSAKAGAAVDESDPLSEPQPGQKGGLMFQQAEGHESQIVDATKLKFLFKSFKSIHKVPVQLVMLNACHAEDQAAAIAEEVDYVIGTNDAIMDDAAWTFSVGFYHMLVSEPGKDLNDDIVRQAFSLGQMNAVLQGEPEDRFLLYIRGELQA